MNLINREQIQIEKQQQTNLLRKYKQHATQIRCKDKYRLLWDIQPVDNSTRCSRYNMPWSTSSLTPFTLVYESQKRIYKSQWTKWKILVKQIWVKTDQSCAGCPKKVLPFDKSSNNGFLFYYLNIFRFEESIHRLRFWHLNQSSPIKAPGDTPV